MKYKNFNEINFLINNYFIIYWKKIIFLIVLSFIGATCISLSPMVLAPALDIGFSTTIEPASNLNNINLNNIGASIVHYFKFLPDNDQIFLVIILVLIFLIIGGFGVLVEFFSHLLSTSITLNVYNKLQFNLYNHILNLNLKFFIKNKSSELTSRFVNDASEAIMSLDSALRQGLQSCIQILIYGFLLIKTSVELAVYVLLISSLHYIINKFLKSRVLDTTSEKFNKIANIGSFLNESFSNFRIIKIFSSQNFQKEKFKKILQQFKNITWKFWLYKHVETPLRKITDMTALGFILILAFSSLQSNELTATGFLLFMVVVRQTIAPISILSQSLIRCYETLGSTRRILDVLNNVTDNKFGKKKVKFF